MKLPPEFSFSQANLQDFADCEYRFYLRHVLKLEWPAVESEPARVHEEKIEAGQQFHRLVQQYFSGIDAHILEETITDPDLEFWWHAFLTMGLKDTPGTKYAEKLISIPFNGYRLLAKYDLLVAEDSGLVTIYDWKTTRVKPDRIDLLRKVQSQVYPLVLKLGYQGLPGFQLKSTDDIQMVYWFPQYPFDAIHLPYSTEQYERDHQYLTDLVELITSKSVDQFQKTEETRLCAYCRYRSLCERGITAGEVDDSSSNLSQDDLDGLSFDVL
ncbi:MAG TPA: PD-(D/E)XK nuclease family protein [Anaerolineaceae bacterium]|nr:PD-(D/E)XK nuclease family protein [Anaerolineaceae bacterium]